MKTHRTDGVSLTFGLIFLFIAGWWLVARGVHFDSPQVGWFLAGGLILLGMLGLIGALRSSRTSESPADQAAEPTSVPDRGSTATGSPTWSPRSGEAETTDLIEPVDRYPGSSQAETTNLIEPVDRIDPGEEPVAGDEPGRPRSG
jgi:hypothetical protein